jgi:hypothetical protein
MTHPLDTLRQSEVRKAFANLGSGAWTIVYKSQHSNTADLAIFSAFAPKAYRPKALANSSWDMSIGGGQPGFVQHYSGNRTRTRYLRYGDDDGLEPLVIAQLFHGIKEDQIQISEEFRLFHNLWIDHQTGRHIKIAEDGSEAVAAEVTADEVRIRTNLLRQFQAARQFDLLLFIDSKVFIESVLPVEDLKASGEEKADETGRYSFHAGTLNGLDHQTFSRFLAKKVLPPPPRKYARIWPYFSAKESYPQFIIGEDEHGNPVQYTCDPNELANYFGKNPNAPHYLTPVFFRRDVLQRYYEHPEKYSVEDGYLSCAGLWGLQLDNNQPDYVIVFLGDLGRDLPTAERDYWRGFNVPPAGRMSDTAIRRAFLAQWAEATAPDLAFKSTYARFREKWLETLGWDLYRRLEMDDEHVLLRLRVPLVESQSEFEGQVLNLTKLLVDSLNEGQLQTLLPTKIADEKGIAKLERWLTQEQYPHVQRDMAFLRQLQALRSRSAAHRKGSDYRQLVEKQLGKKTLTRAVADLIGNGNTMLTDLAQHFNVDLSW